MGLYPRLDLWMKRPLRNASSMRSVVVPQQ
jgi:hypothetical protein